ncbi:hypothetical protein ABKV19_010547 [Rosa sericea]
MMGRPWFLRILTVSCFLALFFSQGFGRNLMERGDQHEDSSFQTEEIDPSVRKMYEVMDYADPEPNVNPRTGYLFTPPPQPN